MFISCLLEPSDFHDPVSERIIAGLGNPRAQAMNDVTQILSQIESGDPKAAEQLTGAHA